MGRADDIEPFLCRELVGAQVGTHVIVENFRRRSRQAAESCRL